MTAEGSSELEQPAESELPIQLELKTPRLLLRPVVRGDLARMAELANDKQIHAFTRTMPYPYTLSDAQKFYETGVKGWKTGEFAVFAIVWREQIDVDRGLVGVMGLHISLENHHGELGYWIGEPFRGHGFATEAAGRVVEFGFVDLCLHRIFASYLTRNPASGRVLEKIGMQREGVLRQHARKLGVFEDVCQCGILRSDFEE